MRSNGFVWAVVGFSVLVFSTLTSASVTPSSKEQDSNIPSRAMTLPAPPPGTVIVWVNNDGGGSSDIENINLRIFLDDGTFRDYSVFNRVKIGEQKQTSIRTTSFSQAYITWEERHGSERVYRYGRIYKHNVQYIWIEKDVERLPPSGKKYEWIQVEGFNVP